MREWTEPDMSFTAGGFLSPSEGYCYTEQLQYYDMLAEPLGYPLPDPDLQLLPHSQQQYLPANLPFSLYGSSSSSTPSPSSSASSSQLCHAPCQYNPHCLDAPCDPSPDLFSGALAHGFGTVALGRRSRVGSGGRSRGPDELCVVCGDKASGLPLLQLTFSSFSHSGFFRRSVTKKAVYHCKSGGGCEMDMYMRRKCQDCRLRKCRAVGMLAECLLTEVQCQSKRLRKGGKSRGQEEEENTDSRRVSSTSRTPGQVLSAGLTREQKYLVDKMVEAHRQFRDEDSSSATVFDWPCAHDGEGLSDVVPHHQQRLLQFARTVPGFDLLDFSDQFALSSVSSPEVMFLLSAQQFSHNPAGPSPVLQLFSMSTHSWLRDAETKENIQSRISSGGSDDLLGSVLNFLHSMALCSAQVTPAPPYRASFQAASGVEKMQELILDLLSRVCGAQCGAARGGPQRFGRLLGRLTELRTLHHNYLLLRSQRAHR
ncbi:nuclear receptor subfamily 1, group H, member 5 [Nematolebias whitei]|uniref:nuclear receptor subfamily 1, group H, member 5 n=1 Tax=Nematolebias whitei TaxID=451745 RepID=UPI00189BA9C5|nr:nuclear receptor subfamily 1, group H, member 5 [Nematolebias whitei]